MRKQIIISVVLMMLLCSQAAFSAVTTQGLILELNGSDPGAFPDDFWTPRISADLSATGILISQTDPADPNNLDATPIYNAQGYYTFPEAIGSAGVEDDKGGGQVGGFAAGQASPLVNLDPYGPVTVEAWIRPDAIRDTTNGRAVICTTSATSDSGWSLNLRTDDGLEAYIEGVYFKDNEGVETTSFYTNKPDDLNNLIPLDGSTWIQVAATYNPAEPGLMRVYHDGVDMNVTCSRSGAWPNAEPDYVLPSGTFLVGTKYLSYAQSGMDYTNATRMPYLGDIACIRVYNRALSADEIQANYLAGLGAVADFGCYLSPSSDTNDDCEIDILDILSIAENWLSSERDPYPQEMRVIFSNDMTNTNTCNTETAFQLGYLYESVDVTQNTGIDIHMLQPGTGWVPFWESQIYPPQQHANWYTQRTGMTVDSFTNKMLQGKDIVWEFLWRCRIRGISPWISLRLNDRHEKEYVNFSSTVMQQFGRPTALGFSQWYDEHPEYRLDPDYWDSISGYDPAYIINNFRDELRNANLLNWAYPEVRQRKLDYLSEICEYGIDGLELDFERHPYFFRLDETTSTQRKDIMTGFISDVRDMLDATAQPSQHRWLSVRIPFHLAEMDEIGIDVTELAAAGVDILNLSCDYYTEQQNDLRLIHQMVPDLPAYLELTHVVGTYTMDDGITYKRYATAEELYTAAHLAYSRGAKGVTVFNFAYYCQIDQEPPYYVFNTIHDPELVAQEPQHYYLWRTDANNKRFSGISFISDTWDVDMAPPAGGWQQDGRLRIQSAEADAFTTQTWTVSLNGYELTPSVDVSEPYPSPYQEGLAPSGNYIRAWNVPANILLDGINEITIEKDLTYGKPVFLDIAIQ